MRAERECPNPLNRRQQRSLFRFAFAGKLHAVVAIVDAVLGAQLFMRAHFHHAPVVYHGNEIGIADGG